MTIRGEKSAFVSGQVGLQIAGRLSVRPGQALEKPAGFMGPGGTGRLSVYSL